MIQYILYFNLEFELSKYLHFVESNSIFNLLFTIPIQLLFIFKPFMPVISLRTFKALNQIGKTVIKMKYNSITCLIIGNMTLLNYLPLFIFLSRWYDKYLR